MSSTNRGVERESLDQYPTPKWCLHRLLDRVELPSGLWLEPCAGAGNIIKAVNERREDVLWHAIEIDEKYRHELYQLASQALFSDAREVLKHLHKAPRVIITNPPFSISFELLELSLATGALTVFLQRLNWCGGPRAELFRKVKPSVYVLPNRPSFTGKGTDSIEYAWFVFDGLGRFEVLDDTPADIRREEKRTWTQQTAAAAAQV